MARCKGKPWLVLLVAVLLSLVRAPAGATLRILASPTRRWAREAYLSMERQAGSSSRTKRVECVLSQGLPSLQTLEADGSGQLVLDVMDDWQMAGASVCKHDACRGWGHMCWRTIDHKPFHQALPSGCPALAPAGFSMAVSHRACSERAVPAASQECIDKTAKEAMQRIDSFLQLVSK